MIQYLTLFLLSKHAQKLQLRVQTVSKDVGSAMSTAIFNVVTRVRLS